jgi:hypothetical protein
MLLLRGKTASFQCSQKHGIEFWWRFDVLPEDEQLIFSLEKSVLFYQCDFGSVCISIQLVPS